jgi:nucleoid DNA-binding protein
VKSKIIAELRRRGWSEAQCDTALSGVAAAIVAVAIDNGEARVPGLGTFRRRLRAGRLVRNPKTGAHVQTTDKYVITFKQSSSVEV